MLTCPSCGSPATKAMYMGIPLKLCGDTDNCALCWGGFRLLNALGAVQWVVHSL